MLLVESFDKKRRSKILRANEQIRDHLIRNRINLINKNKNFEKTLNLFKFINVQRKHTKKF